ncbi:PQQ-dependent sugar dehydrogenase [Acanthopleuribacter pedis]|uniref:PQQ-dependent sugar dehydrogenase n=1 Tax=Acanthopleuribacter pedis TaxID=442870 RepID=A0A8J7Q5M4_9BACT|nr:PQQ-dependent sugar dehydrogenase [Acanthopleuribacter pedis]MBO1318421.1 PQQ-dependent sugar dehydrogenase [Acanthopleuribacter pedis]
MMFVPPPHGRRTAGRLFFAIPRVCLTFWVSALFICLPTFGQFEDLRLVPVVDLAGVVDISHAGDERLFLTTQSGTIHILENDQLLTTPFLDLTQTVSSVGFEQGLLGVAFHPNYAQNGFFFVNYTNGDNATVIARYAVDAQDPNRADPQSARILLTITQPFDNHNGGQVKFGPDGFLYIGMGDGGSANDPGCRSQKPDELLGKMLRIDVDQNVATPPYYGIPVSNPFVNDQSYRAEIWATGLRNPWRFSFDRVTGDLYIADVGQNAREEINFQAAASNGGENYGWDRMEGLLCFEEDADCPVDTPACDTVDLTNPILDYAHTTVDSFCASVTGGFVYRGPDAPSLLGYYLYADYCGGELWAARRLQDQWTTTLLTGAGGPFEALAGPATFGEDVNGRLYVRNGRVIQRFEEECLVTVADLRANWLQNVETECFNGFVNVLTLVSFVPPAVN